MRERPKKILTLCSAVLTSIYLTFIVDLFTLKNNSEHIFVCLLVASCLIAYILKRFFAKQQPTRQSIILSFLISLALLLVFQSVLFPRVKESVITLRAVDEQEVWLTAATVDGQEVSLAQLELYANQGWIYNGDYDDYIFYPSTEGNNTNFLTFRAVAEEINFTFAHNAWSGAVHILVNEADVAEFSLTAREGVNNGVPHTIEVSRTYSLGQILLYGSGAWIVLTFLLLLTLTWLKKCNDKLAFIWKKPTVVALFFLNALFLFFTCDRIRPTRFTQLMLLLLTLAAAACFSEQESKSYMKKYRTKAGWMSIGAISVYASLASFAQRFFLDGNTRIHGSFSGTIYCISGALWFLPVIWLLLFCLEWFAAHRKAKNKRFSRKWAWWMLFCVLAICQLMILWILWPGGFANDAINQLYQANGVNALNDWHPVLHTLLERAVLSIIPIPGILTAVQMLFFVWLLTAFLMIGYDHGLSLQLLCILGCIFELLPNQALSWSNVLKDFPFTLALLWGTYLLLHLARGSTWSRKWSFYFCLALDQFLTLGFRHNGIVPFAAVALLCVVLTTRCFSQKHMRAMLAVCVVAISFAVFKGPVFKVLNVAPNGMSPYTTMLCAVGSCINKGLPLSDKSNQIMETVLPLEDWANYYRRYQGHDTYWWGRPEGSNPSAPAIEKPLKHCV